MALEVTTMSRTRRRFSKEFKLETVKLVKEGPRSIGEVARELDLTESAVRNWVRQFDVDAGVREGVSRACKEFCVCEPYAEPLRGGTYGKEGRRRDFAAAIG